MVTPGSFERDYFEKVYRQYESQNPPRKMEFYRRLVTELAPSRPQPCVLELGCAFGKFLEQLGPRWSRFGVDLSQYAIERARRSLPNATLLVTSCTTVPFEGPFDAIVAFDVLEHVPDFEKVDEYIDRVLAPDGLFLFVVPVYDGPLGWLVHLLDPDPTHIHKKGRAFWLSWAAQRFDIEGWCGSFRYLIPYGPYVHWPTHMFRRQAPAIVVAARRKGMVRKDRKRRDGLRLV